MNFGIEAIEAYFPLTFIEQTDLQRYSGASQGKYTKGLGQLQLAFTLPQEDANSMALTVVSRLLERTGVHPSRIGRLQVGTETLLDKSKSTKTLLMSLFGENHDIEGATSLNACYGATNALLNTLNWMGSPSWDGRYGIVVATDVAAYEQGPARPTGGAGAIAILLGNKPKIQFSAIRSSFIDHQYDFYKPNPNSQYPVVDGKVSMECYINAMKQCYSLQKKKTGNTNILQETDYMCFHTPFYKMIQKAYDALARTERLNARAEDIMNEFTKKVEPSLYISKRVGNIYTGSLYSCLYSLLCKKQNEIAGKSILLFSYGSGLCATMLQAKVISNPLTAQQPLQLEKFFEGRIKFSVEDYSKIMKEKEIRYGNWKGKINVDLNMLSDHTFYLEEIDEKWRRFYKLKKGEQKLLAKQNINAVHRIESMIDKRIPRVETISSIPKAQQTKSFHKMEIYERRNKVSSFMKQPLSSKLLEDGGITVQQGDTIIQNVIGKLSLPLGIIPSLIVNGKEYMVPMCMQEPSVVAASSSIGKFFSKYSFIASASSNLMRGQVYIMEATVQQIERLRSKQTEIINQLNKNCRSMVQRGGGVKKVGIRKLQDSLNGKWSNYSFDLYIDVCGAMGANITNTLAEKAKEIISFMGLKTGIAILSNYCTERLANSKFLIPVEKLAWKGQSGLHVAEKILQAYQFAKTDVYRAVTHNKGIMNGVDAVCLATGQDWRAVSSSAYAYACRNNKYEPLTHYQIIEIEGKKHLFGSIEFPLAVGTIGGTTTKNPLYREVLKIMDNPTTQQLSEVIMSVGLAQNFAALRAMAIQGIQNGHMRLHVRILMINLAVPEEWRDECFNYMTTRKKFDESTIKEFMKTKLRSRL